TAPAKVDAVKCDPDCFNVLISNLVINAIKYNKPHGKIAIDVQDDRDDIVVAVADTGIGIDKKDIELIFEEFTRVKSEQTKDISGTGLGLPICKKIITELGGQINVHSVLHEGSTFTLHLPKYKE
ncbi:ATP-binding protein, partial [candidate division KSB1 bacterium]|nr:ATP-binding protein [candidate division KSB1 bacterium]